jgi:hypothetical protein
LAGWAAAQTVKEEELPATSAPRLALPSESAGDSKAADERRRSSGSASIRGGLWEGTPFSVVAETLPRLPTRVFSATLRKLMLFVLTADAEPAAGSAMAVKLANLRAERLHLMGRTAEAESVLQSGPGARGDLMRAPLEVETRLLGQDYRAACPLVASHLGTRSSAYLERANIACQALAGEHGKAAIGLGLMREQGVLLGDSFAALVTAQQPELAQPLSTLGRADAWIITLLTTTKLAWPDDAVRLAAPALLRRVALSRNDPLHHRIAAGETALLLGTMTAEELAALYRAVPAREGALGAAEKIPLQNYSPTTRGLLYQAAAGAANRERQLAVLANWWRLARADNGEALAARMTAPLVHDLAPSPAHFRHGTDIARALLHAGEFEAALGWYRMLRTRPFRDMEAFTRLGALAHLAGAAHADWDADDERMWLTFQASHDKAEADRRTAIFAALRRGLGERGALRADRSAVPSGGVGTENAADWRVVREAARAGRRGEALLFTLVQLGSTGLGRAEPSALGEAVAALSTLGMAAEARQLAVEAALANGF